MFDREQPMPAPFASRPPRPASCRADLSAVLLPGCRTRSRPAEIVVYCGVDEPYAQPGLRGFREADRHPRRAAVRHRIEQIGRPGRQAGGGEGPPAGGRLVGQRAVPQRAAGRARACWPPTARRRRPTSRTQFKDADGYWTGIGLRARVLAVGRGSAAPPFPVTGLADLADPRLKGKVAMARPTAGATGSPPRGPVRRLGAARRRGRSCASCTTTASPCSAATPRWPTRSARAPTAWA